VANVGASIGWGLAVGASLLAAPTAAHAGGVEAPGAPGVAEDFLPALGQNPDEIRQTLESIGQQCEVARAGEAEDG
jgi:hypothetical protein